MYQFIVETYSDETYQWVFHHANNDLWQCVSVAIELCRDGFECLIHDRVKDQSLYFGALAQ